MGVLVSTDPREQSCAYSQHPQFHLGYHPGHHFEWVKIRVFHYFGIPPKTVLILRFALDLTR